MKRLVRRALIALAVVLLWALGSFVMQGSAALSSGGPLVSSGRSAAPLTSTTPSATADPAERAEAAPDTTGGRDRALGVQLSAHHSGRVGYANRVMARLAEAGAAWVRVDVGWATLQSRSPGTFDAWYADDIDKVLASARQHGLKVILAFWQTPAWASPNGSLYAPPVDAADYGRAISRAAARWGRLVDAWEIWNEPNFEGFFEGADPIAYTRMLCAAYPAVKEYDDDPVLFGGIMYNDAPWLRRAYDAGAKGCFDGLAVHPYVGPSDAAPETASVGAVWRLTSTPMMHDVMREHGDGDKQIWITELGWSTGTENGGNAWDRAVTVPQQADFLRRAVQLIRSDYPYVGPIIWYRDVDGPTKAYQDGFGLMHPDLSAKPSLEAFEASVRGE